jgi:hypothetical protein
VREFGLGRDTVGDAIVPMLEWVLDRQRPLLVRAHIDAFSSIKTLPPQVEDARQMLLERGLAREEKRKSSRWPWQRWGGDPQMGIDLDPQIDQDFELLKTFGPYTIHAEMYASERKKSIIVAHDSGDSLHFEADEQIVKELSTHFKMAPEVIGAFFES